MASINSIRDKDAYWYWILIVFIGITTVCGNTLVIYLIFTRRTLHITANWFILSLSFADLLVGLVVIPTYIIHTFFVQLNLRALLTFYNLILYVSVGNLCVMTGDRYLAITRPLKYASEMTRSKVLIMILIAWMIPTGLSLLSLLWQTSTETKDTVYTIYGGLIVVFFEIIPCFMMLLVYFHLCLITRGHSRRIAAQESVKQCYSRNNFATRRRQRNRERSNLKVFASVALLFVFCWVLSAYRGFCDVFSLCSVSIEFVQISRILIFSNSAVNVVVYSLLKRDIRMELKRLLRCPAHQESLGFGLVHLQESIRANRPLDMGTDVSMPGHQEPGHTSNQSGLERLIWKYYDPKAMLFETVKNFFCIRIQSPACRCTSLGGWKGILNNDLYGDASAPSFKPLPFYIQQLSKKYPLHVARMKRR